MNPNPKEKDSPVSPLHLPREDDPFGRRHAQSRARAAVRGGLDGGRGENAPGTREDLDDKVAGSGIERKGGRLRLGGRARMKREGSSKGRARALVVVEEADGRAIPEEDLEVR
jgi:hypothetical protein